MGARAAKNVFRGVLIFFFVGASALTYAYINRDQEIVALDYQIETSKLSSGTTVKILALSDYHNHGLTYGKDDLVDRLVGEKPDLVAFLGDMLDSHTTEKDLKGLESLVKGLSDQGEFPLYYVSGNHEEDGPESIRLAGDDIYKRYDVTILSPETEEQTTFQKNGEMIGIFGFRDPGLYNEDKDGTLPGGDVEKQAAPMKVDPSIYNVMLTHKPAYFTASKKLGIDLTLAGHTHAGQIRFFGIPIFLNPWSRYKYGAYEEAGKKLLINNGSGASYQLPFRYHCPYSYLRITIKGKS